MGSWDPASSGHIAAALLRGREHDASALADAVVALWTRIDATLSPIVGHAGVAALYQRSVHLRASHHAALVVASDATRRALDPLPLRAVLAQLATADAAVLAGDLLQTFHELLSGMVGDSLSERLLRPVWAELSGPAPTEDEHR